MVMVALAAATWGTIGVTVDLLYRVAATDALSVGFWRTALSAPPLLLLNHLYSGPLRWRVARRDWLSLGIMGLSFAAYQVFYFAAIRHIGVAAAVLVNICSAPLIIALLSGLFLRERVRPVVYAVLVVAVVGAVLLVGGSPEAAGTSELLIGAGLALGAGFAYSLVAIEARFLAPRYPPAQPIALAFTLGTALLLPFALVNGLDVGYSAPGWLLLLYLGLIPTGLGYIFYLRGMRRTPATIAAIVALLEPLISAVLAVTFLGERLSPTGALGGTLLLGSIVFLYWRQSPAPPVAVQ
jgi:DME family drug/metabolite transporter